MRRVGELVEERGVRDMMRRPEGGQVSREGVRVAGEVEYPLRLPRRLEDLVRVRVGVRLRLRLRVRVRVRSGRRSPRAARACAARRT